MDQGGIGKIVAGFFSGAVIIAILSVLVRNNSNAPAFLQTLGTSIAALFTQVAAPIASTATTAAASTNDLSSSLTGGQPTTAGVTGATVTTPSSTTQAASATSTGDATL